MATYAAVASVKQDFANLINYCDVLFPPPFLETLKFAYKELTSFQEFVERLDRSSRKRMNASLGRIAGAIREFEGVFKSRLKNLDDSYTGDEVPFSIALQDLKQDTHSFIETLKTMEEEYYYLLPEDHEAVSLRIDSGGKKSKMVGFSDEYSKLKADIVCYSRVKTDFFSLLGMPGIGKTTLAREIFEDLDILEWFDCRAWVTVDKEWKAEEITQAILAQVDPDAHKLMVTGGYEEIAEYLKESLKGKRYFIVLDDVWDTKVHDYLESSFPQDKIGSRVLLTTRIWYVADNTRLSLHPFYKRLLDEEESWHLLRDKVFAGDSCPPELEKVGKMIAEKCAGLPLTIVTVANLLSKAEKTPKLLWMEVATQKKHQLFIDAYDEISKVLYRSYEDLTGDLKLCFLYMGVFPQDYVIPKSKLINLWIAEKVVELSTFRTLEDRAIECLHYLALHGFVIVLEISTSLPSHSSFCRIKSCGLHSSWWHFCHKEATKNNFFYVLDSYKDGLGEGIKSQSRLSIHNNILFGIKDVYNSMEKNCASTAHSLLCLGPYHQYPVQICFGLKLLQKLDALDIRFYEFPLEVLELVKLRYLALTCNAKLPPSISKLLKLQFLIVNRHLGIKSHGSLLYLPMEIWDMEKLKHLQVMGCDLPDLGETFLPNLLKLSDVSTGSCTKGVLERIPNLKKLGIQIELTPDATEPLCCFDHISHLSELESLKCVIVNPECKFEVVATPASLSIFPSNLKKLNLSGLGYPWEEMSKIASLPYLEVLKLRCNAFRGPKWEIEENGFQKLYFLLIEDVDLVQLKGGHGSFKSLASLSIKHCYKLKELHLRHCEIVSSIEVVDCSPLVEKEIKKIILEASEFPQYLSFHSSCNS